MKLKRLAATFVLVSAGVLVSVACGSSKNDLGGKTTCSPGDTRSCVGPGACTGGQTCGSDGSWGACDCGASGSGGSGGGSGSGTGGSGAGGSGGATQKDGGGTGGTAGDASADAGPPDDPCPSQTIGLNCSYSCGGPTKDCTSPTVEAITCQDPSTSPGDSFPIFYPTQFPFVLRTPSHPGTDPRCTAACNPPSTVFQILIDIHANLLAPATGVKVTVPAPWKVHMVTSDFNMCIPASQPNCGADDYGSGSFIEIVTDDPDAPARNVLIERATPPVTCP